MIRLDGSTIIDAPAAKVWEFISNLEAMPQWTGVLKVEYKGAVGVGTPVLATYRFLGRRTFNIRITEWEPNHVLGMEFTLGAKFHEILTVEPVESIKTRLAISLRGEAKGLRRIGGPLFSYRAHNEFSDRLTRVKLAFESQQQASQSS